MQSTLSSSRERFAAQPSEADQLLERISRPVLAEMAVWPGALTSHDADHSRVGDPAETSTPALWRILVDVRDASAANADDPLDPWPSSYALMREARTRRGEAIGWLLRQGVRRLRDSLTRAFVAYRRRRHTRAIYGALSELDDRTLRDLGFHRSEIWSVAAETSGEAEQTRVIARAPSRD